MRALPKRRTSRRLARAARRARKQAEFVEAVAEAIVLKLRRLRKRGSSRRLSARVRTEKNAVNGTGLRTVSEADRAAARKLVRDRAARLGMIVSDE